MGDKGEVPFRAVVLNKTVGANGASRVKGSKSVCSDDAKTRVVSQVIMTCPYFKGQVFLIRKKGKSIYEDTA